MTPVRIASSAVVIALLASASSAPAPAFAPAPAGEPAGEQQPAPVPFAPTDLGLLETPDRAAWQKPELIMDALRIAENAKVADIGAGSGFFTVRLARRVGPNGVVYAEDIQLPMLESIKRRAGREGLKNVETRLGTATDAKLPKGALDAVLVVDVYGTELGDEASRIRLLRHLAEALKPQGRMGIVNYKPGEGGPGPEPQARLDRAVVEEEVKAAGLRILDAITLPFQYLLVIGR